GSRIHPPSPAATLRRRQVTPFVSIIVPCFNAAATLRETVASVQRQRVRHWQLIIVDDGSSDATLRLAGLMASADPRIEVLSQANAGVSAARNAGLRAASAPWLLFLDADDTLRPRSLRWLLDAAHEAPDAGVVVGRCARLDRSGRTW